MTCRRVAALGASLLVLLACGAPPGPAAGPAAQAPTGPATRAAPTAPPVLVPLKYGLNTPGMGAAPFWVAKEEGIFARYGIDAELVTMTANLLTPALMSGEVPAATMAATALVSAVLGGADLAVYASFQNILRFRLFARPEIASVQDLRGKPVGITGRGGITQRAMELVFERNGMAVERDANMVITGSLANSTTSLLSGAVAAAILGSPGIFEAEDAGMRLLADTRDYGYVTVGLGVVASRGWVARNEDLAKRVVQAATEGVAFALQNKPRTIQVVSAYVQSADTDLLERSYDDAASSWQRTVRVPPEGIRNELDTMAADIPAARDAKPEQFYDNRFADALESSGFVQRLYQ